MKISSHLFILLSDPLSLFSNSLSLLGNTLSLLGDSLGITLNETLRVAFNEALCFSLNEALRIALSDSLWVSLSDCLRASLGDALPLLGNTLCLSFLSYALGVPLFRNTLSLPLHLKVKSSALEVIPRPLISRAEIRWVLNALAGGVAAYGAGGAGRSTE
jgi:hypothetical protein